MWYILSRIDGDPQVFLIREEPFYSHQIFSPSTPLKWGGGVSETSKVILIELHCYLYMHAIIH